MNPSPIGSCIIIDDPESEIFDTPEMKRKVQTWYKDFEQSKEKSKIPKKLLTPRQQRKKGKAFKRGGSY